jgi:hypothetical protein
VGPSPPAALGAVVAGPDLAVLDRRAVVVGARHDDVGVGRIDRHGRLVLLPSSEAAALHRRVRATVGSDVAPDAVVVGDQHVALRLQRRPGGQHKRKGQRGHRGEEASSHPRLLPLEVWMKTDLHPEPRHGVRANRMVRRGRVGYVSIDR